MKSIKLNLEDGRKIEVNEGITFKEIIDEYYQGKEDIVLCDLNGVYYELFKKVSDDGDVKVIYASTEEGFKVYSRTLQYIFIKAALDIFENAKIKIEHSISKGIFGEIVKEPKLTLEDVEKIKERMKKIIDEDIEIKKIKTLKEKAMEIFKSYGMNDKIRLLSQMDFEKVDLYELDGRYDYFYGPMAYSTGIIKAFDLVKYEHGFILRNPAKENLNVLPEFKEEKELANIFYETKRWLDILEIGDVGSLNKKVTDGQLKDIILISEALHEKKIAYIADSITERENVKIVLIAGPSSSGKTTFANRLGIQLRVNGKIPLRISLDDYFLNRDLTPRDENGELDFESIDALDLKLFNQNLKELLEGKEVEIPCYNFKKGIREWLGHTMKLPENGVVVIEGIHGLNPILTEKIDDKNKFKIYISALTQLNLDNHNRIATTDVRKIRRIVRDYLSRGYDAEETLKMWNSIKRGEKKNIFVYQGEADAMFNSTLVYELCVLKSYAIKELDKIKPDSPVYNEAVRLKSFLHFFKEIEFTDVLENSILREFIGGSCFYKY